MGINDEVTEVVAEVVEKGVEAGSYVASESLHGAGVAAKVVVEGVGHIIGGIFGIAIRILGPKG